MRYILIEEQTINNILAILEELQESTPTNIYAWAVGECDLIEQSAFEIQEMADAEPEINILDGNGSSAIYIDGERIWDNQKPYINIPEAIFNELCLGVTVKKSRITNSWIEQHGGSFPAVLPIEDLAGLEGLE